MRRIVVIVEGATEESFVSGPLREALFPRGVLLTPIIIGVPGKKGGRTSYTRVRNDLLRQLKQDKEAYCSTMIDFYGMGRGFPGTPPPAVKSNIEKVEHIERAVKEDICNEIPKLRPDVRLFPYLSLHEYEALLFSDADSFAKALKRSDYAERLRQIRNEFPTPEDINNHVETAPSKRVLAVHAGYQKVIDGTIAARAVTVSRMRQECPHFRKWLERIESLPDL